MTQQEKEILYCEILALQYATAKMGYQWAGVTMEHITSLTLENPVKNAILIAQWFNIYCGLVKRSKMLCREGQRLNKIFKKIGGENHVKSQ